MSRRSGALRRHLAGPAVGAALALAGATTMQAAAFPFAPAAADRLHPGASRTGGDEAAAAGARPPAGTPHALPPTGPANARDGTAVHAEGAAAGGPPRPHVQARPAQRGLASWYGGRLHGRRTASGERFDMHAMTAAHRTLPMSAEVRVHNPANGRSVTVRINDRGPSHRGRMIDLSRAAALVLGVLDGPAMVEMQPLAPAGAGTAREPRDAAEGERLDAACDGATADADLDSAPASCPPSPPAAAGDEASG